MSLNIQIKKRKSHMPIFHCIDMQSNSDDYFPNGPWWIHTKITTVHVSNCIDAFLKVCLLIFGSWTQPRVVWEEGTPTEKLLLSDRPICKNLEAWSHYLFIFLLMIDLDGPTSWWSSVTVGWSWVIEAGKFNKPWETIQSTFFLHGLCSSSCLGFLADFPQW